MVVCQADVCGAFCCNYISIHLNTPKTKSDFDEIRWFVAHENISVYKDNENDWMAEVITPCKFLHEGLCSNYEQRPDVCREYDPENCIHDNSGKTNQLVFSEPYEVEKYVASRWPTRGRKIKSGTRGS